jgi:hypothetical protein
VARSISRIIFENQRVLLGIYGPRLDFTESLGANCKIGRDFLVSDLFSNGKLPWTRSMAHEPWVALDHGGHRTEEAVLAHRSSYSSWYGPWRLNVRWGKRRRARWGSVPIFTGACTTVRRRRDDGGALAQDGDNAGTMRTRRRRVRGVGIFIAGRVTFYRAGEGRAVFMASVEGASMTRLEGTGYRRMEEWRGCHLMGEIKRR